MRYLVCTAILSCCLSGLHTIILTLAYSDTAEDHLLTKGHERAALDMFTSDYRQKVTLHGTRLTSMLMPQSFHLAYLRLCLLCVSGTCVMRRNCVEK